MIIAATMLALAAPQLAEAQDIDTTGAYTEAYSGFGVPNTATFGQTFTPRYQRQLDSFSLFLTGTTYTNGLPIGGTINFIAYLFAWDGQKATGPALFSSGYTSFSGSPDGVPQEFVFVTNGLMLESNAQYVAFLTTSGLQAGQTNSYSLMPIAGSPESNRYSGGQFVYQNNGDDFGLLTTQAWSEEVNGTGDVWFKADFSGTLPPSGVPEPAAWGLMIAGLGFAGAGLRARRMRVRFG
jgi:PEP-CTERM motif